MEELMATTGGGRLARVVSGVVAAIEGGAFALFLVSSGCWDSTSIDDDDLDADGGEDTAADSTGDEDTFESVACEDLSPCVETSSYGYTCPGAVNGVICWNLGSQCDATYLCANTSQACAVACGQGSCSSAGGAPPHPQCD